MFDNTLMIVNNVLERLESPKNGLYSFSGYFHLFNDLSLYRSQNVLGWSKLFVPDQKIIHIMWQSQTFCARKKDDLEGEQKKSTQTFLDLEAIS